MKIAKRTGALVVAMVMSAALSSSAFAGSATATLGVSVRVVANASAVVESAPAAVTVTEADIARGYVDLAGPIHVRVRSNGPRYRLTVTILNDAFGPATLNWEGGSMRVVAGEAWATRSSVTGGDSLALTGRLSLPARMLPGAYHLPFAISASPL